MPVLVASRDVATDTQLSRVALIAVAVLLLVPGVTMLFAWPTMGFGWWMHGPDGAAGPGEFDGAAPAWMLGFWLVGLAVALGFGYLVYRAVSNSSRDPALEELRRAYARGELSDEEYERRRERLK